VTERNSFSEAPNVGATAAWWRTAAIYQIYVRSFYDSDSDGIGDLTGIRQRLPYLETLGVDAIWLTPWYPSPMADAGYDISDFRDIDPVFGTLADADALIAEAHERGIRIIIDYVPNHVSSEHPWFVEALASAPGSAARERFWFREGKGPVGAEPPNSWISRFGGPAWSRLPDGSWYLHMFAPEQPDLNWENPEVRAEFEDILRFWLDRGVDGIRLDSVAMIMKAPGLPEISLDAPHPFVDLDGVHDICRDWRAISDSYDGERILIGEVWLPDPARFALYLRPDELHTAFNFDFLRCPWDPAELRQVIDTTLAAHAPVGAPPTWVLSNHDVTRHVTRYGRADSSFDFDERHHGTPLDLELGTRRARAAVLLTMGLPGTVYIYQGEELGLWEVEDIPGEQRQDPMWERSKHQDPGRDGCRVPIPWSGTESPFGFGSSGVTPWLPQPPAWKDLTVDVESGDAHSMLELYRAALRLRPGYLGGTLRWLDVGPEVLAFSTGTGLTCVVNLGAVAVPLPPHESVLLSSASLDDGLLPTDTAVWLS
jgi:alpha-glucosidase